jgi:hypothetical protein
MRDASDGVEIDGHPKLLKHLGTWARPYTSPTFGWQTAMRDAAAIRRRSLARSSVDLRASP